MSEKDKPKPRALKNIFAAKTIDGALAGVVGVTATFPLDLSKTRLQKQVVPEGQKPQYKNMIQTIKLVSKNEGLVGLYSGYKVNVSFVVFEKAIKLVWNDYVRLKFTDKESGKISIWAEILAGGSAGFIQSCVTTPMELLKIKGQVAAQNGKEFNTIKAGSKILKTQGFKGFYKGWYSTLIRDVPFSFIYFPLYANLKNTKTFGHGKSFKGNLSAGMIAGAITGAVCTPMDVIKTRIQDVPTGEKAPGFVRCGVDIFKKEGVSSLFKGTGPRMVVIGSLFAVAQAFYELGIGQKIVG